MTTPSRRSGVSKLSLIATFGALTIGTLVSQALPAAASTGINVFVGYADTLRAQPQNFPTPWSGSPSTIFEGCAPGACGTDYDAGAVRIVNNSNATAVVAVLAVHVDSCTYGGWTPATLPPGSELIVTELPTGTGTSSGCPGSSHMDTSDVGRGGSAASGCSNDFIQPTVDLSINGQTQTLTDSGQVLNTLGFDTAACGYTNESIQWTPIGHAPCFGSAFTLAPATQTHSIGSMATVTATFTNSCGTPLSNVAVQFKVLTGPNAGKTGTATTDANGQASFSYTSALAGTDSVGATITNIAGTLTSNSVTVIWVPFAPGGGAFVISDLRDINGNTVYWWGAQWWKMDPFRSGALAPASFKGFENSDPMPKCGDTWTTRPGNSSRPPKAVAAGNTMAVIVSSTVTKKGPVISGNVLHIVLVRTNPGYGPNPGHPGTGTIVGSLC